MFKDLIEEKNLLQKMIFNDTESITQEDLNDWAASINRLNCDVLWNFKKSEDLSTIYYQKNLNILENLLVLGSIRLYLILNRLL